MIRVCPNCSNVDVDELERLSSDDVEVECIGECGQHENHSFVYINDELVIRDSEQELFAEVKSL